jgi:Raf kinase inhibitor-like YbhB/YbcL family protein
MIARRAARLSWGALGWALAGGWALAQAPFALASPAFAAGQALPSRYARTHENISPALEIRGVSAQAKSLALIVDDPDAPVGLFTHWLVWNISPDTTLIAEGAPPPGSRQGKNSEGDAAYDGPSPPSGTHRYFFHLYALDAPLPTAAGADRGALEAAMRGHVVAETQLMGTYAAGQ